MITMRKAEYYFSSNVLRLWTYSAEHCIVQGKSEENMFNAIFDSSQIVS